MRVFCLQVTGFCILHTTTTTAVLYWCVHVKHKWRYVCNKFVVYQHTVGGLVTPESCENQGGSEGLRGPDSSHTGVLRLVRTF